MLKTAKVKVNGKINIGLNVVGREEGYHALDTVMAEINLGDTVTVRTRKDKLINLTVKGISVEDISVTDNNVYKTARAFMEQFDTNGADITLKKLIPVGSGLGGSSADIVATVKAMAKAYEITDDFIPLIRSLCSDGEFLLDGGFARVTGRGDVTERFSVDTPIYFIIVAVEATNSTAEVFAELDSEDYSLNKEDVSAIVDSLKIGEGIPKRKPFNALYEPAIKLNEQIEKAYNDVSQLSPKNVFMSGSGTSVIGVFDTVELCLWAFNKLEGEYKNVYIKETIGQK